jgi:hypothetical protein
MEQPTEEDPLSIESQTEGRHTLMRMNSNPKTLNHSMYLAFVCRRMTGTYQRVVETEQAALDVPMVQCMSVHGA